MSDSKRGFQLIGCLFACLCFSLAYAAGFGAYRLWTGPHGDQKPLGVFWEAWDHVETYFYSNVPTAQTRTYGAIRGALESLNDPYTVFVEPQPRELERDHLRGSFGGIGVDLWRNAEGQMTLSPYPDSPAEQAGILKDDVLLSIDGEEIDDETSVDTVRAALHGQADTPVTLTLSRSPTPPFDLTIIRDVIQVPSVTWRVLDQAPEIGYVHITGFTERTSDELVAALQELEEANTTSLVLDLRDNYGGLIDPAVATASQFLSDGVVLYEKWRNEEERTFAVRAGGAATELPLAVLVNGGTASAAEIVSGAIQDYDRAPLIGEVTFGKGSVQLIYELSDGSSVHITSAVWLTPDRHRIDGIGLVPDVQIARGSESHDEQLARAVDHLQSLEELKDG